METAEDDISSGNYAWLAVILVIFGSVVSNIGMNLQKQVHSMYFFEEFSFLCVFQDFFCFEDRKRIS